MEAAASRLCTHDNSSSVLFSKRENNTAAAVQQQYSGNSGGGGGGGTTWMHPQWCLSCTRYLVVWMCVTKVTKRFS